MDEATKIARLREACERGMTDFDEMVEACREGRAQCHEVEDAVGFTSVTVSGPHKVCHILGVAGDLAGLRKLAAAIEEFALSSGCNALYTVGRPGFEKVYESLATGFKPVGTAYQKVLWSN